MAALLSRACPWLQELYVGLTPYNAPGVFSLLAATELTDGVWYPRGGFGTVRDALEKIARKLGVNLRTGADVAEITLETGADGAKRAVRPSVHHVARCFRPPL